MDNVMPPPNGSPEEIQAWNNMMDTMVTFIKASTHLMNTITQKVRPVGAAAPTNTKILMGGCETECAICRPKPPCGICINDQAPARRVQSPIRAIPVAPAARATSATPVAPGTPASNVQVVVTPPTPEAPAEELNARIDEDPEGGENEEEGGAVEVAEGEEGGQNVEEGGVTEESPAEEPQDAPAPPVVAEAPKVSEIPQAAQSAGDSDEKCVCSAIRAKRLEEQQKAACVCPKEKEDQPQEPEEVRMCGCGPSAGNQAVLVQEMVQKLANAQQEINQLQDEMARLQRMDTSRRTGPHAGPNPAALYREIMRDTEGHDRSSNRIPANVRQRLFQTDTPANTTIERTECPANRIPPHVRQRLFQTNTTADTTQSSSYYGSQANTSGRSPDDPANRIPANIRQRLFQTNTTDTTQMSPYGPLATSSFERTFDDPANRIPAHLRQRLFQTNTTADTNQSSTFETTGFDLSTIPNEGRQMPEGFLGCIPCDSAPSSLGISTDISPIPGSMQRTNPMQARPLSQAQMQQRSMQLRVNQPNMGASRQGSLNRSTPAQYVGGLQAPCRRIAGPGGGSGFRSLPTGYQDSPSAVEGGWSQNEQYSSLAGTIPRGPLFTGNSSRSPDSPPRRIVICGPSSSQNNCNPNCQNHPK